MTETPHSDDIGNRIQELDNVLGESTGILKSIRTLKDDAEKIIGSLSQQKDELISHEKDVTDHLQKLMLVSQKAEALLSPILEEKQKLETLDKKVTEALAGIDAVIQQKLDLLSQDMLDKQKAFETGFGDSLAALHKEIESGLANVAEKQRAYADAVSKRIDSAQQLADSQKTAIEGQGSVMKKMSAEDAELRRAIQDNKAVMEKNRHDFDTTISDLRRKQKDELTAALAELHEKQKGELTAALTELYEKQKTEFQSSLAELRDKSIAQLEKENARIKAVLNAAVEKLNHVKFKKLLGL